MSSLEQFFYRLSKIIVFIPLLIIILALLFKFKEKQNLINTPQSIIIKNKEVNKKESKIDLNGPLICNTESNNLSISAKIKDKRIFARIKKQDGITNILVLDDCYFNWQENQYSGEKICGIKPYKNLIKNINLTNLMNSCKKAEIDNKIFEQPKGILFKNMPWLRLTFPPS